ncbi:hypothetical protein [Methanospirillum sp.]|uniref:hypothetical protein n=1 Tax=Methanospirillum sp. TaxID=45200 RepID=UPI0035A1A9A7
MNLTSKNIKKIHQISKNPVCGFFLFLIFSVYNFYGSFILQLHKFTRPTIIDPTAQIHPSASISHWGVHVKKNVIIGENTVIKPHTTIYSGTTIHDRCVIGDTGYQIYRYRKKRLPIIHTGHVIISNDVEIRNNTCIDRAVFGKTTIINSYTRIGMNVKVGHNIRIGSYCLIDDDAAIGGNCTIGDHVHIGKQVAISNRLIIGSHNKIPTNTVQTRDLNERTDVSI